MKHVPHTQSNQRSHFTRRQLMTLAGTAGIGLALEGSVPAVAQTPAASPAIPSSFQESPQFAEQVAAGSLPPVAERLPKNPLVVQPVERIGVYGGTWRMGLLGGADQPWLDKTIGYENLVRWDSEGAQVVPGVAEAFEANDDATEFTFHLREGMKWSDGEPYTADDILFYAEDVYRNPELTPSVGVNPFEVEKIDDYTVIIRFAEPNGLFLQNLATPSGTAWTDFPKHYLSQFHKTYNTTNLDQLVQEAGADNWVELFQMKGSAIPGTPYNARWQNPELPTLFAWIVVDPYGDSGTRVTARRNPYYWKVDPEGNQLPYIDGTTYDIVQDNQVMILKALGGEIDMQDRNVSDLQSKPVLADGREAGGYHFFDVVQPTENSDIITFNQTHKNPALREVFQNKDFRVGLSYAINRQELIDLLYVGQGEPWQPAPHRESPFYNEQLAKQFTEYDLDKANEHLDLAYPDKDADGFRMGPDGKRITFVIETTNDKAPHRGDLGTYLVEAWTKVGVECVLKVEDRALQYTHMNANEHDVVIGNGVSGIGPGIILDPRYYLPVTSEARYGAAWVKWFDPGNKGLGTEAEEPPEIVKQQMDLYRQLQGTADQQQQFDLMTQIITIAVDQFYAIGISTPPLGYGVVKNNFHNVPETVVNGHVAPHPSIYNTCQFFIED